MFLNETFPFIKEVQVTHARTAQTYIQPLIYIGKFPISFHDILRDLSESDRELATSKAYVIMRFCTRY